MAQDYRNPLRIASHIAEIPYLKARHLSSENEIEIAKLALRLQEEGNFILYPQSRYLPFDLLVLSPDMQNFTGYCLNQEAETNKQLPKTILQINA